MTIECSVSQDFASSAYSNKSNKFVIIILGYILWLLCIMCSKKKAMIYSHVGNHFTVCVKYVLQPKIMPLSGDEHCMNLKIYVIGGLSRI